MSEPLRVGVDLLFLDPGRRSGTATYAWSLLDRLRHRADLRLVLYVQDGHVPSDELAGACEVVTCPRFGGVLSRVAWEQLRLPWQARRDRIDVLFSPGYVSPLLGSIAKVVTVHDLYFARYPSAVPLVRRLYYRLFIRLSVHRCERVIAVSQNTRDDLALFLPGSIGKTRVVWEAARTDITGIAARSPDLRDPYFLMVASVTDNKNVDTVTRAAVGLRRRGIPITIQVVGEDPYGLLAEAIDRHGAADVVVAVGEIDDARLAGYYREAVAVIHPSRYEGFGLPALEAQAMGVPLISSRGGALPEVVGEGALYFDHDSPDELIDAMTVLLDDDVARSTLIERGHHNVARFSWSTAADETAEVLFDAVAEARSPSR